VAVVQALAREGIGGYEGELGCAITERDLSKLRSEACQLIQEPG
jgi:hypothetical protein